MPQEAPERCPKCWGDVEFDEVGTYRCASGCGWWIFRRDWPQLADNLEDEEFAERFASRR